MPKSYRDIWGYHQGGTSCSPCAPKKCVQPAPICKECPPNAVEKASRYPFRPHFECLSRQELEELLEHSESFRIYGDFDSDISVVLAALHFLSMGNFHKKERESMLGIMGNSQTKRYQYKQDNGWASSIWGQQYLDLMTLPRNFAMGGAMYGY